MTREEVMDIVREMLASMLVRGKVQSAAALESARMGVQATMFDGDVRGGIELLNPTGRTANPPTGTDVILLSFASRDHQVAVCADNTGFFTAGLEAGEFADSNGVHTIAFKQGQLTISSSKPIVVQSTNVQIGASGQTLHELLTDAAMAVYNGHTHPCPGGTTGAPNQPMASGTDTTTALTAN